MNKKYTCTYLVAFALLLTGCSATGAKKILGDLGFPQTTKTNESSTGTKVAGGLAGCAVGGAAGYYGTKYLSSSLQKKGLSSAEIEKTATVVAGLGCIVGGAIALKIIKNMDEKSKKAQDQAWAQAQTQSQAQTTTSPQAWKTNTHEGTVQILEPVTSPDGQQCATRKNYVKTPQGEAEQFIPVCKNSSGIYEVAET